MATSPQMSMYKPLNNIYPMSQEEYTNELIKKRYFSYLEESEGYSQSSIQAHENAIILWQQFAEHEDFGKFNKTKAKDFKEWLKEKPSKGFTKKINLSYCYHNLQRLKKFFSWLAQQPNYKSRIIQTDIQFLNLSKKETRAALATKRNKIPTLDEVIQVIESIDPKTEIDMRDRALICFTLLTGARITAISSLPIESFDKNGLTVDQNPKLGVKTKFSKRIVTTFFPISYEPAQKHFIEWFDYLVTKKDFAPTDPIFPATKLENGKENINYYNTGEVEMKFWQNSSSARKIFEKRFTNARVPYYHPHTLRHLVVREFTKIPLTEEEKKAISQNLGHENVGTTFGSYGYGNINEDKQISIVRNIDLNGKQAVVRYQFTEQEIANIVKQAQQ